MKKWVALFLALTMALTSTLSAYGEVKQSMEADAFDSVLKLTGEAAGTADETAAETKGEEIPETIVNGERFSKENLTDGKLVYFGVTNITIGEGNGIYRIPLFREGDISESATVTVHSLDMTALYGKDYLILGSDKTEYQSNKTLVERSMSGEYADPAVCHFETDEAGNILSAKVMTATPSEADGSADRVSESGLTEENVSELLSVFSEQERIAGKSRLALLKEQETGLPTRETVSVELNNSLTDTILSQLAPGLLSSIYYSCEQVIRFEAGQDTAYLGFRVYDDQESEGSETFSVVLTVSEGAEPYMATSLSVVLEDDEETVRSRITFDQDLYEGSNGEVTVTLKRTDAMYSIATADLTGVDEQGNEELYGTAAFSPYEEKKEISLHLDAPVTLKLADYSAAEAGERTTAMAEPGLPVPEVPESSEHQEESELLEASANGNDDLDFEITVGGKSYTVKYKKGDTQGTIYDTGYNPALEVGQYIFALDAELGGKFVYGEYTGANPGWKGHRKNEYSIAAGETDYAKGEGILEWYYSSTSRKGSAYAYMNHSRSDLLGIYYQFVAPDWEMTSNFGGGQEMWLVVNNGFDDFSFDAQTGKKSGKFSREVSMDAAVQVKDWRSRLGIKMAAVDDTGWQTPKSYGRVYGVAAFYKKYTVSVHNPAEKEYITGISTTQKYVPSQFEVRCGAQKPFSEDTRDFYANPNEDVSNLVFTMKSNYINGASGIYSVLKGYTIVLSESKKNKKVTLSYPEDFYKFLDGSSGSRDMEITKEIVKAEKEKIASHLDTICIDKYFMYWIECKQNEVYEDGASYYQTISFTPVVDYNNVEVTIADKGDIGASFLDTRLKAGSKVTFHAGDLLDLSAQPDDPTAYRVTGYEVSTDGGVKFNSIRETKNLLLQPNKNYVIRPLVVENDNRVEIVFTTEEAKKNLQVCNLIPESMLDSDPELKGRYILNLHPDKKTAAECMDPIVGDVCAVQILVTGTPSENGYVYRPVITDKLTGRSYNTQEYDFTMRTDMKDNVIRVGIEKVRESDLKEYTLSGRVVTKMESLRDDGLGKHSTAAAGYSVIGGNGQSILKDTKTGKEVQAVRTVTSVTTGNGSFSLPGMKLKEGDRITLTVDNGSYDAQVVETVVKGSSTELSIGEAEITYPINVPGIISLSYDYDKASSREKQKSLEYNSIRVFDDFLTLTAVVDLKDRKIAKAVFDVITVTGSRTRYEAKPIAKGANVFTVKTENMLEELHNGDRVYVYLVDEEKQKIRIDTGENEIIEKEMEICYPTRETGLVFYVENEVIAPKELNVENSDAMKKIDVPLLGTAAGKLSSGTLGFSRTDYPNGQGYSITVNFKSLLKQTRPNLTPEQQLDYAKHYIDVAEETARLKKEAIEYEQVIDNLGYRAEQVVGIFEDLDYNEFNDINAALARNEQNSYFRQAKAAAASLTREASIQVDALFCLDLEFVHDPVKDEFVLATAAVTVGGSYKANKSWYALVGYVPCFLNLSGAAQANLVLGGKTDRITEDDFNQTSGNIKDILSGDTFLWEVDTLFIGKVSAGVGLCNILSARGVVSASLQLQFSDDNRMSDFWGIAMDIAGGFTFDLVISTLTVNIGEGMDGWGTLAKKGKISFFNNTLKSVGGTDLSGTSAENTAGVLSGVFNEEDEAEEAVLLAVLNEAVENGSVEEIDAGTFNMSSFGKNPPENMSDALPGQGRITPLLEDAADRTRPELIDLEDGRLFLVFLGGREGSSDACLYYAIRDTSGKWSEPLPVAEDGTYDTMPDVLKVGNHVYIVWADASKELDPLADFKEKYQSFAISGAVYDIASGTMGEEFAISQARDQGFLNMAPRLSSTEDAVYCIFLTEDVSRVKEISEIADMYGNYETMQISRIDRKTGAKKNQYAVIRNPYQQDPAVIDYCAEAVTIAGKEYLLTAYTVDLDGNLKTETDRELYLEIHNVTDNRDYYPIRISENLVAESVPQLSKLNGSLYLGWLSDGTEFSILDVRTLIESFFNTEDPNVRQAFDQYDPEDEDWYLKSASDLGMTEETFDKTVYALLHQGDFGQQTAILSEYDSECGGIGDYVLTGDGRDVYIYYTDFGASHEDSSQELYGMRYVESTSARPYDSGSATYEGDDVITSGWYFTKPVQITDSGKAIDDFTVLMDTNRNVFAAADYYEQSIDGDGRLEVSDNTLAFIDFTAVCSIVAEPNSVYQGGDCVTGETAEVSFNVVNKGLTDAKGIDMEVYLVQNGKASLISWETADGVLAAGHEQRMTAAYKVPEDLSGTLLRIVLTEHGTAGQSILEVELEHDEKIEVTAGEAVIAAAGEGKAVLTLPVTVRNSGSKEAIPAQLLLLDDENEEKIYDSAEIPALKSGQEQEYVFRFEADSADWNSLGSINLKAAAVRDGQILGAGYGGITSGRPLIMELRSEENTGTLTMKTGAQTSLSAKAAPWGELLTDLNFVSSDPSVVTADQNGVITAAGLGTAVITAYSSLYGISDSITVLVTYASSRDEDDSGKISYAGPVKTGTWNDPVTDGTWIKGNDGKWSYRTNAYFRSTWGYILNPYAREEKYKYSWFYFDADGKMLTGWQKIRGKWYYLNPASDGCQGMCYLATTTPDGFRVDENGAWTGN